MIQDKGSVQTCSVCRLRIITNRNVPLGRGFQFLQTHRLELKMFNLGSGLISENKLYRSCDKPRPLLLASHRSEGSEQ